MLKKALAKKFSKIAKVGKVTTDGNSILGVMYSGYKRHNPVVPLLRLENQSEINNQGKGRKSAFDYINDFVKNVIPKVENFVEYRLLEKFKLNLSHKEKVLVEDAYRQRKIRAKPKDEIIVEEEVQLNNEEDYVDIQKMNSIYFSEDGRGLSYHTFDTIGKYTKIPADLHQETFPFGFYGNYLKDEYYKTKKYSLMCREEGLKACHLFSNITNKFERNIPYNEILNKTYNFKEKLKYNEVYSMFFQEISHSMIKILAKHNKIEYYRLFSSADVYDSLVT